MHVPVAKYVEIVARWHEASDRSDLIDVDVGPIM